VPVCLPKAEYVDYGGVKAVATSFQAHEEEHEHEEEGEESENVGKRRVKFQKAQEDKKQKEDNLVKTERELEMKSDEECDRLLNSIDFDPDLQICTFNRKDKLAEQLHGVS
jgi:hypothetical protein